MAKDQGQGAVKAPVRERLGIMDAPVLGVDQDRVRALDPVGEDTAISAPLSQLTPPHLMHGLRPVKLGPLLPMLGPVRQKEMDWALVDDSPLAMEEGQVGRLPQSLGYLLLRPMVLNPRQHK